MISNNLLFALTRPNGKLPHPITAWQTWDVMTQLSREEDATYNQKDCYLLHGLVVT